MEQTRNYYKILQVERNAKADDLREAADAKHKQINDAYDVLSDPQKRALYDQQHDNHIFSEFFGYPADDSSKQFVVKKQYVLRAGGGLSEVAPPRKATAVERTLPCSLEDLYNGATRRLKISRDVVGASGRRSQVEEVLTVEIKPGWKKGTKITFAEKGNDVKQDVIPADVIFTIDEKPHSVFKRDGSDLIVAPKISLADALRGHAAQLTTLDGRNLTVSLDSITSLTHQEVVVKGEGMPIQNERPKKGNLIVKFDIQFPKVSSVQKAGIIDLLACS